jgi:xanthine dehydrogenase YagR molybdenum-binding subunit
MTNGSANVQIAAHDLGTGAYTVIGQVAAESLGIPLSSVTVELGDSELPPAPMAGGSNTTASACSAVMKACQSIRARLMQPVDDRTTVGSAGADRSEFNLEDRFKSLGVGAIEEYAEYLPPGAKPDSMKNLYAGIPFLGGGSKGEKLMYATGAEFVEARVHSSTREIRVPRIVGAFAAGRLMNTRTARSQYMGAMIWGISSALHEATEIDPRTARSRSRRALLGRWRHGLAPLRARPDRPPRTSAPESTAATSGPAVRASPAPKPYSSLKPMVGTTNKSMAAMSGAWFRRKVRHS